MPESTSQECLRAAWRALLCGDIEERDRLCRRAEELLKGEEYLAAVERVMAKDFYVTSSGVAIPVEKLAQAAKVIQ